MPPRPAGRLNAEVAVKPPAFALTGRPPGWACDWGEDQRGWFAGFRVGEVVHRLRWVPRGQFMMGSPGADLDRYRAETPPHEVRITRGFWLGETPVPQSLWQAVLDDNPSHFVHPDRPVEQVSWHDAHRFIRSLAAKHTSLAPRLPTEAEWEYACRAGTRTRYWFGDSTADLASYAWYRHNSGGSTHPVGQKPPNPWGLFDMHGNVLEWCEDFTYRRYPTTACVDPVHRAHGELHVIRGGAWNTFAPGARAANRDGNHATNRDYGLGFRLAADQP